MKRKLSAAVAIIVVIVFTATAVGQVRNTEHQIKLRDVQLQERGAELKKLELKYQNLNVKLENTDKQNTERIQQLEKEKQELDSERQRLERELQAKLERKEAERVAAENRRTALANALTGTATASAAKKPARASYGGNKQTWLAASGIPQSQWWAVDEIVTKESGWNPCAYNPGKSDCSASPTSACGLAQSLPCGKQAKYGHWTDPVANLKWQYEYVTARYGGYPQAVAFWRANHWY